jgi:DNA-binding NarL/FixJ family response regulator
MRIVVAEPSAVVRDRVARLLEDLEGVSAVHQASDSSGLTRLVRGIRPDVLVLAAAMDGGLETLGWLRDLDCAPNVIVLTNFNEPEAREAYLNGGAAHLLDKTRDLDRLVDIVRRLGQRADEGIL